MHWGFALGLLGLALVACGSDDAVGSGGAADGGGAGRPAGLGNSGSSGSSGNSSIGGDSNDAAAGASAEAGSPREGEGGAASGASGNDNLGGEGGARATAANLFIDQLRPAGCLPLTFTVDDTGQVECTMIEAKPSACDCAAAGRGAVADGIQAGVRAHLVASELCTAGSDAGSCADFCMCAVTQEQGAAQAACQADPSQASQASGVPPGFCYIDDPASAALAACPPSQKQKFGFVSPSAAPVPAEGATLFVACIQ